MARFERCGYCGDLFFAEDVRRVKNGRLYACCLSRVIKLKARKGQGQTKKYRGEGGIR